MGLALKAGHLRLRHALAQGLEHRAVGAHGDLVRARA
jgi:hypothetical protein